MLKTITQVAAFLVLVSLTACGNDSSFSGESTQAEESSAKEERPKRSKATKERTSADATLGNEIEDTAAANDSDAGRVTLTIETRCADELYSTGVPDHQGTYFKVLSEKLGYHAAIANCELTGGELIYNRQVLPEAVQACSMQSDSWIRPVDLTTYSLYQTSGDQVLDPKELKLAICYYQ